MTAAATPDPRQHPDASLPLVGRAAERELLGACLSRALSEQGSLVFIGGEAGIGKTTLVGWLRGEAARQGALVLGGGCYDLSTTPPYGPWLELAAPSRSAGDLPPVPSVLTRGAVVDAASQAELFEEVRAFLAALASAQPLVLILEDLHWADAASLELLRSIGRSISPLPLLLVATHRRHEVTRQHPLYQLLPALVREAQAERLDLRPLHLASCRRRR